MSSVLNNVSISRGLLQQVKRYLVAGGCAFVVDYSLLYLLSQIFAVGNLAAATASFVAGAVVNYVICIRWVFDVRVVQNAVAEFSLFFSIGIIGLVFNGAIIWLLTDLAGVYVMHSKLVAAAAVLMLNFILRKTILFSGYAASGVPSQEAQRVA